MQFQPLQSLTMQLLTMQLLSCNNCHAIASMQFPSHAITVMGGNCMKIIAWLAIA